MMAQKSYYIPLRGLPRRRTNSWLRVKEKQKKPALHLLAKPTEQAHFCLGVRTFGRTDPKRYALKVLNIILGANMSSRLFISIRERQGLCYYIRSSANGYFDTGTLDIQAGVDLKRIPQAIRAILHELDKLKKSAVSDKELKKAKEYIKGKIVLALEDTSGTIQWLGMQELLEADILSVDEIFRRIDAVTKKQIQALARQLFVSHHLNLAMIAPFEQMPKERLERLLHF